MEQPFHSFSTKEKQACFLLIAEVLFVVSSCVTVKVGSKKQKYSPQGGKLSFHFGGSAPVDGDNYGGVKSMNVSGIKPVTQDRPDPTPGVKVIQHTKLPVKKDKDYPF